MNEYDRMCEDDEVKVNADGQQTWAGFEWASPINGAMREDMCESLRGEDNPDRDDDQIEVLDEAEAEAMLDYLADPKHGYDQSVTEYSAADMIAMFRERAVPYTDWYEVGAGYLEDHYPGLLKDSVAHMDDEHVSQVGANLGGSDHEVERYLWVEANDGRIFAIVRPAYVQAQEEHK